jgi:hypothetical protein
MGDNQGNSGGRVSKLRLAYDSTATGGDGQFHEVARAKPYDPTAKSKKPAERSTRKPDPEAVYDGQYDVHAVQRQIDAGIDFDRNLDTVMYGVQEIDCFLHDVRKKNYAQARDAMCHQLRRVAVLEDGAWASKQLEGATRGLKKKHGKKWETYFAIHHDMGELRHCTVDGVRGIAVAMLFREQRKDGTLEGAKALIDFMDLRAGKGFPPPTRSDKLADAPKAFMDYIGTSGWAYNRQDATNDISNTYAVTQEWPYDWVMRDHHPALLKYMVDKQSCLLVPTLEITPKIVQSYFQTQPNFVHGRPLQSDRKIDLSQEFVDVAHPLARLPGHMRHLVDRASHMERPDIRHAGRQALEDITRLDFKADEKLRAEMLRLKKARNCHQAIWSPPENE